MTPEARNTIHSRYHCFWGAHMTKRNDFVGRVFARLTVTGIARLDGRSNVLWACACTCGGEAVAYAYDLSAGKVTSCGCRAREGLHRTHGMSRTSIHSVWSAMVQRCTNPNDQNFHHYGGRGITVTRRWLRFEGFLADMGTGDGLTLERRDNDKGYSKGNCYWATRAEQSHNRRTNVHVTVRGTAAILSDALTLLGYTKAAFYYQRNKHGLTAQEVIDKWLLQKAA